MLINTGKFFKDSKIARARRGSAICSLKNFPLLTNTTFHLNHVSERAGAIFNLHSCHYFALVLHENALVFSQSEAQYFFMYTTNS